VGRRRRRCRRHARSEQAALDHKVFHDYLQQETGRRGFILSRYGDWGSERYPAFFTGDAYSQWPVLAYEVAFSARGGNVLVPYISHDIGGFHGARSISTCTRAGSSSALSARSCACTALMPIRARAICACPGSYGSQGMALVRKYFTLHTQLLPYLYTYTWLAHNESMPILRPLYLQYPDLD